MTLLPLRAPPAPGPREYVLLPEALDRGTVEVTETDEGGSVSELLLHNRGDQPVLVLGGQVLLGAKQHRA